MNTLELTGLITVVANGICRSLSVEQMAVLAGIFVQLGDTVATIAAQKSLCQTGQEKPGEEVTSAGSTAAKIPQEP